MLSLTYSIADQNFLQTKSIGILNLSLQLPPFLVKRPELNQLVILSNSSLDDQLQAPPGVPVERHNLALKGKLGRMIWDQWGVYRAAQKLGTNWLYLPKGFASFARPCPVKLVTCMADANHDYYTVHYPRSVPRLEMWYFERSVRASIRHSDLVVTISDFTAEEVARLARKYQIPAPPIRSVGIGFERVPIPSVVKQNRILVFAGRWPHKRTALALEYLARWQEKTDFPGSVEWVGRLPDGTSLPSFKGWRLLPRMPENEFRRRVAEAQSVVYFSEYEGFGMPPVEALIAATDAVYSDLPATREVMQGAGHPFSNESYESFHEAMNAALRTSPEVLAKWADELLARHNWDKVADRIIRGMIEVEKEQPVSQETERTSLPSD